jgi:hypothetical protein
MQAQRDAFEVAPRDRRIDERRRRLRGGAVHDDPDAARNVCNRFVSKR